MAAGGANALADAMGPIQGDGVTRRQVIAGLRDADDRLAGLQLMPGQAVIEIALEVECGHPRVVRVVEPLAGTEFAPGDTGKAVCSWFPPRSAHALFLCVMFVLALDVCTPTPGPQRLPGWTELPTTLIQRHSQKSLVRPRLN